MALRGDTTCAHATAGSNVPTASSSRYLEDRADRRAPGPVPPRIPRHAPTPGATCCPALAAAGYRAVAPSCAATRPPGPRRRACTRSGSARPSTRARCTRPSAGDGAPCSSATTGVRSPPTARPSLAPERWRRVVTMAVPPPAASAGSFFTYEQLKRSWYVFFFQTPLAEFAVGADELAFIDRLWADWSPGYDGDVGPRPGEGVAGRPRQPCRPPSATTGPCSAPPPPSPSSTEAAGGRPVARCPAHPVPARRATTAALGVEASATRLDAVVRGVGARRRRRMPGTSSTSSSPKWSRRHVMRLPRRVTPGREPASTGAPRPRHDPVTGGARGRPPVHGAPGRRRRDRRRHAGRSGSSGQPQASPQASRGTGPERSASTRRPRPWRSEPSKRDWPGDPTPSRGRVRARAPALRQAQRRRQRATAARRRSGRADRGPEVEQRLVPRPGPARRHQRRRPGSVRAAGGASRAGHRPLQHPPGVGVDDRPVALEGEGEDGARRVLPDAGEGEQRASRSAGHRPRGGRRWPATAARCRCGRGGCSPAPPTPRAPAPRPAARRPRPSGTGRGSRW